jgi:hypothetical protein
MDNTRCPKCKSYVACRLARVLWPVEGATSRDTGDVNERHGVSLKGLRG